MAKALCDSHEIANLSARCGGERGSRLMSCTTYPTLMVCSKHPDIPWMSGGPWAAKLAQRSTDEWPQCRAKGLARVACLLREAGENTPLCGGQKPLWLDRLSAQSGLVGCRSDGNTRKTGLGGCLWCRGVQPNGRFASSPAPSPLVFAPSWLVLLGARQTDAFVAQGGVLVMPAPPWLVCACWHRARHSSQCGELAAALVRRMGSVWVCVVCPMRKPPHTCTRATLRVAGVLPLVSWVWNHVVLVIAQQHRHATSLPACLIVRPTWHGRLLGRVSLRPPSESCTCAGATLACWAPPPLQQGRTYRRCCRTVLGRPSWHVRRRSPTQLALALVGGKSYHRGPQAACSAAFVGQSRLSRVLFLSRRPIVWHTRAPLKASNVMCGCRCHARLGEPSSFECVLPR